MTDRKKILKEYKLQKQPAGIYAVHNTADNKMYIGKSKNLPAVIRRFEFTLRMGSFPFQELIDDYKRLGAGNFKVIVLDELDIRNETDGEIDKELLQLEEMWIEKLRPEGIKFYNAVN